MNVYHEFSNHVRLDIYSKANGVFYVLLDLEDMSLVKNHRWHINFKTENKMYAESTGHLSMARLISGAVKGDIVDHKNGCTLDNRKVNIRKCSIQENAQNKMMKNKHGYKGVEKTSRGKFCATIKVNNKRIRSTVRDTEVEAAKAYNEMALKYFGEYALLNQL